MGNGDNQNNQSAQSNLSALNNLNNLSAQGNQVVSYFCQGIVEYSVLCHLKNS